MKEKKNDKIQKTIARARFFSLFPSSILTRKIPCQYFNLFPRIKVPVLILTTRFCSIFVGKKVWRPTWGLQTILVLVVFSCYSIRHFFSFLATFIMGKFQALSSVRFSSWEFYRDFSLKMLVLCHDHFSLFVLLL